MSEAPDKESKTEEPTPKKLADALEEGNAPVSKEAGILASLLGIAVLSMLVLEFAIGKLLILLQHFLDRPEQWRLRTGEDAHQLFFYIAIQGLWLIVPLVFILIPLGLMASFAQMQPRFAPKRIKPDISKLSIKKGFGRIFGAKGLVEFLKTLAKFFILSVVGFILLQSYQSDIFNMMQTEPAAHMSVIHTLANTTLIGVSVAFLIIVAADIAWTRHTWFQDLKMTREEVKDEQKQVQGDPIVRSKMRSMIRDLSRKRMISSVPKATMVVVNPTHYAVALRYVKDETPVPMVLAKGTDHIALKIREVAEKAEIPLIEDKALARSLFDAVEVDQAIPPQFYEAIASLVLSLMKKNPAPPIGALQ
ncbi:MAG: flagellar biosynthesis protein FlhB [Filomicrobium sp.]